MKAFEHDGFQLDTGSGYDRKKHPRTMTYWIVVKDSVLVDLVRENPLGTSISLIDSIAEKDRTGRAKQVPSVYWPRRFQDGLEFVAITAEQLQNILSSARQMSTFRKVAEPKKYSDELKRQVIEARASGQSWGAISRLYDVPRSTAQRFCSGVRNCLTHTNLQGRCTQSSETRIDKGPDMPNPAIH